MEIQTKKYIALFLTGVFGTLSIIGFYVGKQIPTEAVTMTGMVIAYYFGKGDSKSGQ